MEDWLFPEEDFLEKLPSRKQMTLPQDLKVRELIHDFLVRLATLLKVDGRTILSATIYVNRLYMRLPITTSKYFVASAAMAISCKLNDTVRAPDKIALLACQIKNPNKQIDQHSSTFWQWRDQLLYREEIILKNLNFDVDVELPYDLAETLSAETGEGGFHEKIKDIVKHTVSKIEILSALPIFVAYSVKTVFGAMLVLTVWEAQRKIEDVVLLHLPPAYILEKVGASVDACLKSYLYILKLQGLCQDAKIPSHRAVVKKIVQILEQEFLDVASGKDKGELELDV